MFRNSLIAAIRTGCAALVTLVLAWVVATLGVELPPGTPEALAGALFAVAVGAVNLAVNWGERRWPVVGWLLGVPKTPTYVGRHAAPDETGAADTGVAIWIIAAGVVVLAMVAVFGRP